MLAAVLEALDEGNEEVAVTETLDEEDQSNGHASEQDAEDTAKEDVVTPAVFFGPSGASPGSFKFTL